MLIKQGRSQDNKQTINPAVKPGSKYIASSLLPQQYNICSPELSDVLSIIICKSDSGSEEQLFRCSGTCATISNIIAPFNLKKNMKREAGPGSEPAPGLLGGQGVKQETFSLIFNGWLKNIRQSRS